MGLTISDTYKVYIIYKIEIEYILYQIIVLSSYAWFVNWKYSASAVVVDDNTNGQNNFYCINFRVIPESQNVYIPEEHSIL